MPRIDLEPNEIWKRAKIYGVPLARYVGGGTRGKYRKTPWGDRGGEGGSEGPSRGQVAGMTLGGQGPA